MATAQKSNPFFQIFLRGPMISEWRLSKEEFLVFNREYEELQMERLSDGRVILMPLSFAGQGGWEASVGFHLKFWQKRTGLGHVLGSNAGFDLPDGSTRAADATWISGERWEIFTALHDVEESFVTVAPELAVEILPINDNLKRLQEKMMDVWMANGVRLGWLIDPDVERVYIYRENEAEPEVVEGFAGRTLSGENVCPGLEVPLDEMIIED